MKLSHRHRSAPYIEFPLKKNRAHFGLFLGHTHYIIMLIIQQPKYDANEIGDGPQVITYTSLCALSTLGQPIHGKRWRWPNNTQ